MTDVAVIHLVRGCNPPAALDTFLAAYRKHTRPEEADLILALKGFQPTDVKWPSMVGIRELFLPDTGYDIGSYRRAAEILTEYEYLVFTNSWSKPLVYGWVTRLIFPMKINDLVGIAGCTGSHEIEPHIRTNAFAIKRANFLDLYLPEPQDKTMAHCCEVGPMSITRQLERKGLQALVVGLTGVWELSYARGSDTFRWGDQRNLMVSDNRTGHYQDGTREERQYLERLAWGCTEYE